MLMKKIIALFVLISLVPTIALADISCSSCKVGDCTCNINDCDEGIVDIFPSLSCSTTPTYEFTFSDGILRWNPETARSYSTKVLCSDGETQSDCEQITAKLSATTTTTKLVTTTTIPKTGDSYLFWILLLVIIVIIALAIYYFYFRNRPSKSYEELYRKWRK